jgi:hypothetical protein
MEGATVEGTDDGETVAGSVRSQESWSLSFFLFSSQSTRDASDLTFFSREDSWAAGVALGLT